MALFVSSAKQFSMRLVFYKDLHSLGFQRPSSPFSSVPIVSSRSTHKRPYAHVSSLLSIEITRKSNSKNNNNNTTIKSGETFVASSVIYVHNYNKSMGTQDTQTHTCPAHTRISMFLLVCDVFVYVVCPFYANVNWLRNEHRDLGIESERYSTAFCLAFHF